jgi:1,4-dihydroxy-2-naphthoate octaprenyltransferase
MTGISANPPPAHLGAYLRLAKVDVPQVWLGVFIGWSAIPLAMALSARTVVIVGLLLLALVGATTAAQTFDDVRGFQDGTDEQNYQPESIRNRARKPLLDGRISMAEARRLGWTAAIVSVVCVGAVAALTALSPLWIYVVMVVAVVVSIQYSGGAGISYRVFGGGELVVSIGYAISVVATTTTVTGSLSARPVIEGAAWGLWIAALTIWASSNDAVVDRSVGRRTIPAAAGIAVSRHVADGALAVSWLLLSGAVVAGVMRATAVLVLPALVLQLVARNAGVRHGRWLVARRFGFLSLTVGAIGLIVVNLVDAAGVR